MNITQSSSQSLSNGKKAVMGGGMITAPAVAAHLRSSKQSANAPSTRGRADQGKAVMGGGMITTPAVTAHMGREKTTSR